MGAAEQYLAQPWDVGRVGGQPGIVAKARLPFGLVISAHVRRRGSPHFDAREMAVLTTAALSAGLLLLV